MREKGRPAIYGLAAVYLLYLAYQMFGARMEHEGSDYMLMVIFCGIFVIIGIALLAFSVMMFMKQLKNDSQPVQSIEEQETEEQGTEEQAEQETEE